MGAIIVLVIFLIALFIFLIFFIKYKLMKRYILKNFEINNVLIYGKRGKGKGVLTQYIIKERKKEYYSNLNFGYKFLKEIVPADLNVAPNTFENLINNNIVPIEKVFKENCDFYIDDVGNYLPSHMDSTLHKRYPSLPIFYSLSRHLYNSNVHGNAQTLIRIWKTLREQGDFYINCIGVVNLPFCLIVKFRTYEKYETANLNLLPMKKAFLNKHNKALYNQFVATHGEIKKGFFIISKRSIKYDTRAFHEKFFGVVAPKKERKSLFKRRRVGK